MRPIAKVPQKATRKAPLIIDAPPAYAAVPPRMTNVANAVTNETWVTLFGGANKTVAIGTMAPPGKKLQRQARLESVWPVLRP